MLIGGAYLLKNYQIRIPVIYAGKFATTFLFIGFAGLLLNFPLVSGLGVCDISWLPGFNSLEWSWGIWPVYAGLVLNIFTTTYYIAKGLSALKQAKREQV